MTEPAFRDPSLPVADRVEDLLARMTLAEKVGQMLQLDARDDLADHVLRRQVGSILHTSPERLLVANELTSRTRLRIPLLVGADCIHGHSFWPGATIYPPQLGLAASCDPDLLELVARATAVEVAATGIHWTFSPVLCIARDLRWGRVSETFGEDPLLIGELAAAMVRGYQGDGLTDPTAILATAKHFAGYSETQGGRDASEADISRRKLRSWFLPPFERVAREGCRTFMLGYQSMDGVPITVNHWLLSEVLRGEWGYRGTLVTDWDNVGRMVWEQQVQPDHAHAAAAAVRAGNDLVMTTPLFFEGALEAVELGLLAEDAFDDAVRRILTLKFELGLFDDPYVTSEGVDSVGTPPLRALGHSAQARATTLLVNAAPPGAARIPLQEGLRVYSEDVDARAIVRAGLSPVADVGDADVAIVRLDAPFEPRDDYMLESSFHAGSLEFASDVVERVERIAVDAPVILAVQLDRPAILTPLMASVASLVAVYGASDDALLDALTGKILPEGKLPFQLPRDAGQVIRSHPDVPGDVLDPLFDAGAGGKDT
ncbi:MAG: glycoside hydrolase family 3 C-terminal domain-containing protein [Microbacterium sp.]|nr:glycoside hydrolase family 3 C-terminal domain-containing protein [Microbacterium sp.]